MYHSEFYKNVVAVTNRSLCERPFLEQIERVCACHPKALILREKDLSEEEYFLLAKEVLEICRQYQVSCILHTYVEAARKLGHPCIHLPLFLLEKYQGKLGDFQETGCSVHSVEILMFSHRSHGLTQMLVAHVLPRNPQKSQKLCCVSGCVGMAGCHTLLIRENLCNLWETLLFKKFPCILWEY